MRRILYLLTALVVLIAACGGDAEDATSTTQGGITADADTTSTTAAETTTTAPSTTTTGTPATGDLAPLAAALAESASVNSARTEGAFTVVGAEGTPSGSVVSFSFTGAFDTAANASLFIMDLSEAAGAVPGGEEIPADFGDLLGEIEIRTIGDLSYMKFPLFTMFGVGTEWVSMPAEDAGNTAASFGANPSDPFEILSAFANVEANLETLGTEQVRGVNTTHFRVTVDVEEMMAAADDDARSELDALGALPGGGALPVEFWIGDDGLPYRFSFEVDGASVAGSGFESMTMLWEMYDYGADVGITAPPADQVTDGSDLTGLIAP